VVTPEPSIPRRLETALVLVVLVMASVPAWLGRDDCNQDGLQYLEAARAWSRGDVGLALNGYWSPLYSWLVAGVMTVVRPGPDSLFAWVHALNLAILVLTVAAYRALLRSLARGPGESFAWLRTRLGLSAAWAALLLALVSWADTENVTPDLLVVALYLVAARLAASVAASRSARTAAALGAVLGLAALAKAAMFPTSLAFVAAAAWGRRGASARWRTVASSVAAFALVAGPFVVALSASKGKPTFGGAGKLNYAWYVNGVRNDGHWSGAEPGSGTPRHAWPLVETSPPVYDVRRPFPVSFPTTYDLTWAYEGLEVPFDLGRQADAVARNGATVAAMPLGRPVFGALAFVALAALVFRARRLARERLRGRGVLLLPALVMLVMYAAAYVEPRHVAAPMLLLVLLAVDAVAPRDAASAQGRVALAAALLVLTAVSAYRLAHRATAPRAVGNVHAEAARTLEALGTRAGDGVAYAGGSAGPLWALLADVRIVGEVPRDAVDAFLDGSSEATARAVTAFRSLGARVVVARRAGSADGGLAWTPLSRSGGWWAARLSP
jgi:hypothetical protein